MSESSGTDRAGVTWPTGIATITLSWTTTGR